MTAINSAGDSATSGVGNGAIIPTTLGAPQDLIKDRDQTTTSQVSFTWSAPDDDGGSPILDYSIEIFDKTTGIYSEIESGLTQTAYSQSGLTENTIYQFRLRARNSLGYGDYSTEISISTLMESIGQIYSFNPDSDGKINVNGETIITIYHDQN